MEKENIFSWRRQDIILDKKKSGEAEYTKISFKSASNQQRADFYYKKLSEDFKVGLTSAELARQRGDSTKIRELVDCFASEEKQKILNKKLIQRKYKALNVYGARTDIDLGLAGFFRIDHVHANSMAKLSKDEAEKLNYTSHAVNTHKRHFTVQRTTDVTPYTLDKSPIDWDSETTQDIANTYLILGQEGLASTTLYDAIIRSNDRLNSVKTVGSQFPDKLKRTTSGIIKGRGIMRITASKITRQLIEMIRGVHDIKSANKLIPNYQYFTRVNFWYLQSAFTYEGSFSQRMEAISESTINLVNCLIKDKQSVINAAKQLFTQKIHKK